jgi:hypothetical protein
VEVRMNQLIPAVVVVLPGRQVMTGSMKTGLFAETVAMGIISKFYKNKRLKINS